MKYQSFCCQREKNEERKEKGRTEQKAEERRKAESKGRRAKRREEGEERGEGQDRKTGIGAHLTTCRWLFQMRVHEFAVHHVTALIGCICCRNITSYSCECFEYTYDHWFVIILISKFCEFANKHFLITHINLLLHAILKNIFGTVYSIFL